MTRESSLICQPALTTNFISRSGNLAIYLTGTNKFSTGRTKHVRVMFYVYYLMTIAIPEATFSGQECGTARAEATRRAAHRRPCEETDGIGVGVYNGPHDY